MVRLDILESSVHNIVISTSTTVGLQVTGVRKQFLIMNGEPILAFLTQGKKFPECSAYTEVLSRMQHTCCSETLR